MLFQNLLKESVGVYLVPKIRGFFHSSRVMLYMYTFLHIPLVLQKAFRSKPSRVNPAFSITLCDALFSTSTVA